MKYELNLTNSDKLKLVMVSHLDARSMADEIRHLIRRRYKELDLPDNPIVWDELTLEEQKYVRDNYPTTRPWFLSRDILANVSGMGRGGG